MTPLLLPGDGEITAPTLADHLETCGVGEGMRRLIEGIAAGSVPIARRLALGALTGDPTAIVGGNDSGDKVKALDQATHDHMVAVLRGLGVRCLLSEEAPLPIALDPEGAYDVAMDPIDGSGSIGIGAPLGLLFAMFPAGETFLRKGREVIAAGYVSFGHSCDFGFSSGGGVDIATLDPATGTFHVDAMGVTIPETTNMIALNLSNRRDWSGGLRRYADDMLAGKGGPRGINFNTRWIAAAVGDLHRILRQGGVFLYPADARSGSGQGFLRLPYEAFPIAFLIEQAGGAASDGQGPILDLTPDDPHARVPLFFGARGEIATIQRYLSE